MASSKVKKRIECALGLRRPIDVAVNDGAVAGILDADLVDALVEKEPIHRHLANLPGDESSIKNFVKRWGRITSDSDGLPKTLRQSEEILLGPQAETTKTLRKAHPQSQVDWDAPILFFEGQKQILQLRDTLRMAWNGNANALKSLQNSAKAQVSTTLAFKEGQIEITVSDAWGLACLLFLLDEASGKATVCGNPECPARYFIAGRKNQKFCDSDQCFAFGARERARAWFREHGKEWREQRRKEAKQNKGRKQR